MRKILIVDDISLNRAILEEIFMEDFDILHAENGIEALNIIDKCDEISAILLDVMMPKMNGIEFLEVISEKRLASRVPIFIITADPNDEIVEKAYDLGVMDVISKPIVSFIVKKRVLSVVELFESRKDLDKKVQQQTNEIVKLNKGMIQALATAIEFRSNESGEHVNRIHDITKFLLLNTELGSKYTLKEINDIALAAIMHDIGKIAISDSILNKPGKLTLDEYQEMKKHTLYGCELLEKIPQMRDLSIFPYAYDIARHHHERWDGRGYPDGLIADEISIPSQIVALADVYDALVSKRVYKDAYNFDQATTMIKNGECGQFSPYLLKIFEENEVAIRKFYK